MTKKHSLYRRMVEACFSSKLGAWIALNIASRVDPFLLRATHGRISSGNLFGYPALLLTTIGAKTGLSRPVAAIFFHDEGRIVIVASRGGTDRCPNWYHNLKANPVSAVLLYGYSGTYIAREVTGEERERLWAKACDHYAGYAAYQKRVGDRQIPVLVLTPQA